MKHEGLFICHLQIYLLCFTESIIVAIYLYILDEVTRILQQTWWGIIFGRAAASGEETGYCWHCRGGGGVKLQDTSMEPSFRPSSGGWVKLLAPASSLLSVSVHKGWNRYCQEGEHCRIHIFTRAVNELFLRFLKAAHLLYCYNSLWQGSQFHVYLLC